MMLSSRVATEESRDGDDHTTLYRPDVRYSYEVAGRRYESTRHRFGNAFTDNRAAAETTSAQYVPDASVPCFVNPDNPSEAVLDRRSSPFLLVALLPAAIAGLGVSSVAGGCLEGWRRRGGRI